jgi:hypothetical protein|nr:MAG TPA: hypothetical protein [Caudoviricetes sp.]
MKNLLAVIGVAFVLEQVFVLGQMYERYNTKVKEKNNEK